LHWTPHAPYTKSETSVETELITQDDGRNLFRTAQGDADIIDGKTSLVPISEEDGEGDGEVEALTRVTG